MSSRASRRSSAALTGAPEAALDKAASMPPPASQQKRGRAVAEKENAVGKPGDAVKAGASKPRPLNELPGGSASALSSPTVGAQPPLKRAKGATQAAPTAAEVQAEGARAAEKALAAGVAKPARANA